MSRVLPFFRKTPRRCLGEEDLSRFVAGALPEEDLASLQFHLAECSRCREELAGVLRLLHPEGEVAAEELPEPTEAEIAESYELVRRVALQEGLPGAYVNRRLARLAMIAAAAVLMIAAALGWEHLQAERNSRKFLSAGIAELEPVYADSSPSGLRLDLPFRPGAARRSAPGREALERSENLFYQALALRGESREAHLGLGAVYLGKSEFGRARSEFDKALQAGGGDLQALLGRGVAGYEEALAASDPAVRAALTRQALADFESVLGRDGRSLAARYNRIRILYDTGRHREALAEIESYLRLDDSSIWAARLRELKRRMELARPEAANEEAEQAAAVRDSGGLEALVRLAPDRIPGTIQHVLRLGLEKEGGEGEREPPSAEDLLWAGETLAASYAAVTGDGGYVRQADFYRKLPFGPRAAKRALDARFKWLSDRYRAGEVRSVLEAVAELESGYRELRDIWQLAAVHFLKGNCLYYLARFEEAEGEYRTTLGLARELDCLDLIARSLAGLGAALSEQRRAAEDLACNSELRELARAHHMEYWAAYASRNLGNIYLLLGRLRESMRCYLEALLPAYRLRDEGLLVNTLENLGLILDRSHRLEEARGYYDRALGELEAFSRDKPVHGLTASAARRLNLLANHADLSLRMGDLAAAERGYGRVLEGAKGHMPELACRGQLGLAAVRLAQGRAGDARALAARSLAAAEAGGFADVVWRAHVLEARLLGRAGRSAEAAAALEKATAALESISQRVPAGELRYSFVARRLDPYREIVALLVGLPGGEERARLYAEQAKTMAWRDWPAPLRSGAPGAENQVLPASAGALPAGYALLEYFFVPEGLVAFVSEGERTDAITLGVRPEIVEQQVDGFLHSADEGDRAAFERLSLELGRSLIEPVLARLGPEDAGTLVICPDGPLYRLPFAGLRDGQGRYLVERYALAYAPARSVFLYCLSLGRGDAGSRARSVLLVDGSAPLRGASMELAFISRLYGRNASFLETGSHAARDAVRAEILHFAGHAFPAGGKPVLALGTGRDADYLDALQVSRWRLQNSRLVNLAACGTGAAGSADMPWGLAPAFFTAGAPAVLVSLMPVGDRPAGELNTHFYSLLAEGALSKARALQQAQSALIAEMRSRGEFDAAAWLPFIIVGDPR